MTSMLLVALASCASPPPAGQMCDDTVELASPTPSWLPLAITAAFIVVAFVVTFVRVRRRRRS
ncbi:hypothetical protein [Leifsonia sp. SIMBA_070]|uniref:hypothetical protein n=1 Tax=Leifsonia sp. SIMBA_070 TaxID=3085810 RepID=UPI003978725C